MYLLKNIQDSIPEEETVTEAIARLKDSSEGLVFDPGEHRYFLGQAELRSVSSIVEHFAPFDELEKARSCAANPKGPYFGMSAEEIIEAWHRNRDAAAAAGTAVHEFAEACLLYRTGQARSIEKYRERVSSEGFLAESAKEEAVARWWENLDTNRYAVVAKETMLANTELGYAGTMDLLLYDRMNGHFCLRDYKTNKDLFKSYGKKLTPPLDMIQASDHGKYTVQQNLYRIQLQNIGIQVSDMALIWLKDGGSYEEVTIPEYGRLITYAIKSIKS